MKKQYISMTLHVLMVASVQMVVIWVVALCSLVEVYQWGDDEGGQRRGPVEESIVPAVDEENEVGQ
jgi:hypothetical protein